MKKADIKNKVVDVTMDYYGDPIKIGIAVNFLNDDLRSKIAKMTDVNIESLTPDETASLTAEFATVMETMVARWDIEDAEPTASEFVDFGLMFCLKILGCAMEVVSPGKALGAA